MRHEELDDNVPPQDSDAELATLGAMMFAPSGLVEARAIVREDDFYRAHHRAIYRAIVTIADRGDPVDVLIVDHELQKMGPEANPGGKPYLVVCIESIVTMAHVKRYATFVAEAALLRKLMEAGLELYRAAKAYPDSAQSLLEEHVRRIASVRAGGAERGAALVGKSTDELARRLEELMGATPHLSAARTGIFGVDRCMGGLSGHTLIVPRGVEKAGKSMFGMQCLLSSALAFAEEGKGRCAVAYVLEGEEIWQERAIAWLGPFNSSIFRPTVSVVDHEHAAFSRAVQMWRGLPLYVTGEVNDLDAIITDLRRIHMAHPVGLVLIDYAQLIQGGNGGSNVERNEDKANRLAGLAAELHCPIIVPSQVTKGEGGW